MVSAMSQTIMLISVVATFSAVYLGILGLARREETLEVKLQRFTALRSPVTIETEKRDLKCLLARLGRLAPRRWSEGLDIELIRGNIPIKGGEFLVLQGFLIILFFFIGIALTQKRTAELCFLSLAVYFPDYG